MWPSDLAPPGYCRCGCGIRTTPYPSSWAAKGWVKGEPRPYVHGHNAAGRPPIEVLPFGECWEWQGKRDEHGYGRVVRNGRDRLAHRWVYARLLGPIPEGHVLDHLCRNTSCVNPEHLEPVSDAVNTRRGNGTKLTESTVDYLRVLWATQRKYMSQREFARQQAAIHGVDPQTIRAVVRRLAWNEPKLRAS